MDDMYFAEIQAQLANLASLRAERSQTPSPMWQEPHQAQHDAYWQPYEEYYQQPQQQAYWQPYEEYYQQPQQQAYWQPYEESYARPYEDFYAPPQPPPQSSHENSGKSNYYEEVIQQLNSLEQGREAQPFQQDAFWQPIEDFHRAKELAKWNNQFGQNEQRNEQIQEQIDDEPQASKQSLEMDEQLLLEEEEDEQGTAREEPPSPHPPQVLTPPTPSKVAPNLTISDLVPPIVPLPCRFLQSTQDEVKQDILDTFPKIQEEDVVEEHLEFKQEGIGVDHKAHALKIPHLAENSPCYFVENDATFRPILQPIGKQPSPLPISISINGLLPPLVQEPNQIQVGESICMDLRKDLYPLPYKDPMLEGFEEHVREDVLEFFVQHVGKQPPTNSISFYTNFLLILMIKAPILEFQPLPEHFKYHRPFHDHFHAVGSIEV